ncbi:MAG: GspH/FimT family pseudopilin [Pseudomonadota bacterium]|nr:GspH/FimT family pseudopilin [Pseudomonadota bacterium]
MAPSPVGGRLGWGQTTSAHPPWSAPTPTLPQRGRGQETSGAARCARTPAPSEGQRRRPLKASGFTLIELLVVFALLALLVALVPIAFNRLHESAQYRDTVRAALTGMRQARQQAQSSGTEVRFAVNPQARSFGVEGGTQHHVPEPLALHAVMAAQETADDGSLAIRFLPRGGATGGSLDIVRPSGDGVRLRVDWFSGRVEQEPVQP